MGSSVIQAPPSNAEGLVIPSSTGFILTMSHSKAEGATASGPGAPTAALPGHLLLFGFIF